MKLYRVCQGMLTSFLYAMAILARLVLLSVLLPKCSALAFSGKSKVSIPKPPLATGTPAPAESPDPDYTTVPGPLIVPLTSTNYGALLPEVQDVANGVLYSDCFGRFMLTRKLNTTRGLSNPQVLEILRTPAPPQQVSMYYQNNNVVGYRQPPSNVIHTNSKFHNGANLCSRASNIVHEWAHTTPRNFAHGFSPSLARAYTVPYSINAAFSACCFCKGVAECGVKP
jgi:hypothetical protein